MNHSLDHIHVIDSTKLSSEFYVQSLLEEAHNKGLLSSSDIERLQYECLDLLAYQTERYNAGDSSSIRVEQAESMMTSILFTIGVWLKTYPNPDAAVTDLQQCSIRELYQKGRKQIDTILATTKTIHETLLHQLVDTRNVFYRETLEHGILGFFKLYCPDFSAQEIHITADYPLFNPMPRLAGIEFIKVYVEMAYQENLFCSHFSPDDIHHLLCGYEENYQELLINIYELALTAALGCSIAGTDPRRLILSEGAITYLIDRLTSMQSHEQLLSALQKAADELDHFFQLPPELTRYIQASLPLIGAKIRVAAEQETLDQIFFVPVFPEDLPHIVFFFGKKMEDEQYRKIIEELRECRFSQDKVMLIQKQVHSLADLEDVLLDAELTWEEIQALLHKLDITELAALSKKHPLMPDISMSELRESEQLLTKHLHDFISLLPQKQQDRVAQAVTSMQEE